MNPFIFRYNNFLFGTISATDTATGYDVNNIVDWREFTYWKSTGAGTKYITLDGTYNYAADTLGIAGHNLFTVGASVRVEYYNTGTGTWDTAFNDTVVTSNNPLLITFPSKSAYDWRLVITNSTAAPQIGILMISTRTEFPVAPSGPLVLKSLTPRYESYESEAGFLLGVDRKSTRIEVSQTFKLLTTTWVDGTFLPMWIAHLAKGTPFFYAVDLINAPLETYYLRMAEGSQFNPEKTIKDYYDTLTLNMVGAYDVL